MRKKVANIENLCHPMCSESPCEDNERAVQKMKNVTSFAPVGHARTLQYKPEVHAQTLMSVQNRSPNDQTRDNAHWCEVQNRGNKNCHGSICSRLVAPRILILPSPPPTTRPRRTLSSPPPPNSATNACPVSFILRDGFQSCVLGVVAAKKGVLTPVSVGALSKVRASNVDQVFRAYTVPGLLFLVRDVVFGIRDGARCKWRPPPVVFPSRTRVYDAFVSAESVSPIANTP